MDCPLNYTFLLTFKTLVWRILLVRALTVVSCCGIFPNPSRQYSKRQTRGREIEKCLDEPLEPSYYFIIFTFNPIIDATFYSSKSVYTYSFAARALRAIRQKI